MTKAPVPYVLFTEPLSKHDCPTAAACWSPRTADIGISLPTILLLVKPKLSAEFLTYGKIFSEILSFFKISLSHLLLLMLNNMVLQALVASVK